MTFDKDLYEVLGLKKNATDSEIRKAFLKLAKKYHPDVNTQDKEAEQRFKEINLAYEVLKDSKKKTQYDQMRAAGRDPFARAGAHAGPRGAWQQTGGFGAEGFSDIGLGDLFQEIFGGGFGGFGGFGGAQQSRRASRGADREAQLSVGFIDAARGAERSIEFSDGKRLAVKIPEGVSDGSKIRLANQGDPGIGGGLSGDLILTLHVEAHPYFVREGQDLIVKLPITFSEAVLGGEVPVPTLDGNVFMKIPKGVSSGQRLKLAGKGIKSPKTGTRGDEYVELFIKVPKDPSASYVDAAEKLKQDAFNPRIGS